jgi:hypothetical protein
LFVAWSLQLGCKLPKEPGLKSQLIGLENALIPMSHALDLDPGWEGRVQKESLMSYLDSGLDGQQQVGMVAPSSSSGEVGGCIGISCQAA